MTIKNIKPVNKILSKTSEAKCPPKPTRKKPEATNTMALRPTANICSPGTDVDIDSKLANAHCISSSSKTYHEDDWVKVDVIVYSNRLVHHVIDNDTVLSYSNLKVGGNKVPINFLDKIGNPLSEGYISLQSEGHPVEFRNIKIKEL